MSTYAIYFNAGASHRVEVEAEDLDSALDAAYEQMDTTLCHRCAGKVDVGDFEVDADYYEVDGKGVTP